MFGYSNTLLQTLLLLLLLLLLNCSAVLGETSSLFQNVSQPQLDYSSIGDRIGFFGSFSAVSFYSYKGISDEVSLPSIEDPPDNSLKKRDNSSSSTTSTSNSLYVQDSKSNFNSKYADLNGSINQLYRLSDDTVILNGDFTTFNGKQVKSPLIYNITSNSTTDIITDDDKVDGHVNTIFIDNDLVYLGGNFTYNSTAGAAIYNITSKKLSSTLFQGFGDNAVINSISKLADKDDKALGSILFGGSFNTLGLSDLLLHNMTTNSTRHHNETNSTIVNAEQQISLRHGSFTAVNAQDDSENSLVICPSEDNVWQAQPSSGAEWKVELPDEMKGITPTKARIYIPESNNGIKLFRIYSFPNNGIMNLTYIDPETNELSTCDAWCPLVAFDQLNDYVENNIDNATELNRDDVFVDEEDGTYFRYYDPSTKTKNLGYGSNFQEFAFIDSVSFDSIGLTIIDWYGEQGAFSGFELYQNSIQVFGNNTLNEPNCGNDFGQDNNNYAEIISGDFQSVKSISSVVTNTDYMVSYDTSAKIALYPNISYSGDYSIIMTTPGCAADNSCSQRVIVNVTVIGDDDDILSSNLIYQNNENVKFDYLYSGHLNSSDGSSNRIEVSFHEAITSGAESPFMVIDKVVANIVSLDSYYDRNNTNHTRSSLRSNLTRIELNGLFEYSLANFSNFDENLVHYKINNKTYLSPNNTYIGNSSINLLSSRLSNSSVLDEINFHDESLFILGQFESNSNNLTLSNNNLITLNVSSYNTTSNESNIDLPTTLRKRDTHNFKGATFNNSISKTFTLDNGLLVLGQFSISDATIKDLSNKNDSVSSANNFAILSTDDQWYGFGNDYENAEFDQFADFTLDGVEYYVFSAQGSIFKTWDNTNFEWSSRQFNLTQAVSLTSSLQVLGGSGFSVMDFYSNDQAYIKSANFSKFGIDISSSDNSYISSSFYVNDSISVIGGKFNSSDVENVGIINNKNPSNSIQPLQGDILWEDDTMIQSLYADSNGEYLFVGMNSSVSINDQDVTGLVIYDLKNDTFASFQPAALSNSNGNPISVNSIVLYDDGKKLLVGGDFDTAGSLSCQSLCVYDIANTRWLDPQNDNTDSTATIDGVVTDMKFYTSSRVLISGRNLTLNNNNVVFLTYNFKGGSFDTESSLNSLNKTVNRFILNDRSNSDSSGRMIAMGDDFIYGFDGSKWSNIDNEIDYTDSNHAVFHDLKLLTLSKSSSYNGDLFDKSKILLVAGTYSLKDYGPINMALYNGTSWIPYVYTTSPHSYSTIGDVKTILIDDYYRLQSSDDLKNLHNYLSRGKVVGISLACALGSTSLFGLLYLIPYLALLKNRKGYVRRIHEQDMIDSVNPEDLLHEIDLQREK
ncbi:Rax2 plasma membrane protein [Candida orthopsilosis Co 90-125]|uniref:Rax2 plasma membrane protein n=1 Tax=Candida orthopsilosis (strain 90-125) TaxID=1136231 RepID=H8X4T9_CANO9|nr:Rax2 plasma membrane protein [Candida orthopsilosis Co 90-125]CCG23031.1 Rax2 plasma membrane protein [Candida orthopsilosis Co 90-125]